jgi:hypothetical protein
MYAIDGSEMRIVKHGSEYLVQRRTHESSCWISMARCATRAEATAAAAAGEWEQGVLYSRSTEHGNFVRVEKSGHTFAVRCSRFGGEWRTLRTTENRELAMDTAMGVV